MDAVTVSQVTLAMHVTVLAMWSHAGLGMG